jgi:hypothetical protein
MMRDKFFYFIFIILSNFNIHTQELGINVDQLLNLKRDSIERTSSDDKFIDRRYFVFRHHPDDPNYEMLYTQNYEEEYFFINNKLYFIVKEYRAVENRWKSDLAGFMNKYSQSSENSYTTPDGSWFVNEIAFYNEIEQYQIFIYRPSQRWNAVYRFAPGEVIVRIVGRHFQYLREYQTVLAKEKERLQANKDTLKNSIHIFQNGTEIIGRNYYGSNRYFLKGEPFDLIFRQINVSSVRISAHRGNSYKDTIDHVWGIKEISNINELLIGDDYYNNYEYLNIQKRDDDHIIRISKILGNTYSVRLNSGYNPIVSLYIWVDYNLNSRIEEGEYARIEFEFEQMQRLNILFEEFNE